MPSAVACLAPASAVPLEAKVRFLGSPAAYAGAPASVRALETHMSWVFLAGREAYKLKKPVQTPLLDFSTLAARQADCLEEVRLNRRLAPDVYLGIQALTFEPGEGLSLGGRGAAVDCLVHMRRLPARHMMERVIARGALTPGHIESLGGLLANFYTRQQPAKIDPDAYLDRFRSQHLFNMAILGRPRSGLDCGRLHQAAQAVETFLDQDAALLKDRVRSGRVVEGHGDLRPEHICLTDPPMVIDCLEFSRFLRLVDPFEEVAYLGLECARLKAGWVGESLRRTLENALDDHPPDKLLAFHTVFRALLRAQLTLAHLDEPSPRMPRRWPKRARSYLDLAQDAVRLLTPPRAP